MKLEIWYSICVLTEDANVLLMTIELIFLSPHASNICFMFTGITVLA